MRNVLVALAVASTLLAGCATELGAVVPECDRASGTMVLAVQSVPGSRYVSCVESLPVGWDYRNLTARSGKSQYILDSDRMGDGFLIVDNMRSCDRTDAELDAEPIPGVELWKDVDVRTTVSVALIPEGPTFATIERSDAILAELDGTEVRGREISVEPYAGQETTRARIDAALADGAHAVIIGIRNVEDGTLGLRLRGSEAEITVDDIDDLVDEIEDVETESSYLGNWYFVFEGGCVRYTFDAEGPGTARLDDDARSALGLYDAEELRQVARDLGFDIP